MRSNRRSVSKTRTVGSEKFECVVPLLEKFTSSVPNLMADCSSGNTSSSPSALSQVKSYSPTMHINRARAAQDKCMCEAASDAAQSARAVFQAANFIWIYLYSNIVVRWPSRGKRKGKCSRWSGTPAPTFTV